MTRFLLRRLAASLLLLFLVLTVTFFLLHLAPGDPANLIQNDSAPQEYRERLRAVYGLDRPLPEQYLRWLGAVARGDWGVSFSQHRPVARALGAALPATLLLAGCAALVQYSAGLALGVAAARRQGKAADHLIRIGSLLLYSQPVFWLGLMAVLLFSLRWPILPASHLRSVGAEDWGTAARLARPRPAPGPPRPGARPLRGGRDRPLRAQQPARGDGPRVHPHRPRQGALGAAGGLGARHAQRPPARDPALRALAAGAAQRLPGHRGRLLPAGARPAHGGRDPTPATTR